MIHHGACFFELEPRWRLTPHVFSPSSQQPAVLEDATALFGPPLETPFGEQKTEGESLPFWSVCFYVHIHVKFELWIFEPVWVVIAGSSVARRWEECCFSMQNYIFSDVSSLSSIFILHVTPHSTAHFSYAWIKIRPLGCENKARNLSSFPTAFSPVVFLTTWMCFSWFYSMDSSLSHAPNPIGFSPAGLSRATDCYVTTFWSMSNVNTAQRGKKRYGLCSVIDACLKVCLQLMFMEAYDIHIGVGLVSN